MFNKVKQLASSLRRDLSGNATMLVAMGMPALIGGTGLAVDTAQWFMWKRELQFAVDQAAIAGAWARTSSSTRSVYAMRATQEFAANVSMVEDFDTTPVIALANYAAGNANSVTVSASATRQLPFSSFLTGDATTVNAYAQASFAEGQTFTSCLIAVDEDDSGAIIIGGNSVLTAGCGMAALSNSPTSIIVNGNPDVDTGYVLSRGGIDNWFDTHTDDEVHEYLSGLFDPFATLSPPNPAESQVARTYACASGTTSTKASIDVDVTTTYTYWKGANTNSPASNPSYSPKKPNTFVNGTPQPNQTVANGTTAGSSTQTTTTWTQVGGSGNNKLFEKKEVATTTITANVVITSTPAGASLSPGTYSAIKVSCNTTFTTGVYIINGGDIDINAQNQVTGNGVMFVLKNGAGFRINGGASVNLTAIQASDLIARGVSSTQANKLAGMLVFEDRASVGNTKNVINGNASTVLNGTIYLSKSNITFQGTASVTSQCLMIAAATITITGTANMTTFCPPGVSEDTVVASEAAKVKLVA